MHNVPKSSSKPTVLKPDAIVISGISGIYPNADNNFELCQKLYNKVDMVSKDAYPDIKHIELPRHYGKINGVDRFDAQFFRVTPNQAHSFEPVGRKVMEQAYSAMFDAGVNPETMKGTNLGVFVGFAQSDLHSTSVYDLFHRNSFILSGTSKTMMANRISYWIDAKGPSFGVDVGCASSMVCLKLAYEKMLSGECDAAIVCGTSHNTQPVLSLNMKRAGLLCLDGKTKCFDKKGDGYVRSEAVNILFLQKAKDAKRVYAEICHVNGFYFPNTDSSFLPICNPKKIEKFLEEFYSEIHINPEDVDYIEANATGIAKADSSELEGIIKVFGKNHPIKIGSIKSNLGHTESASGTTSVIKVCLAYQKGELPANLHHTEPLDIPAVKEGGFEIVTNNTSFGRGYAGINNFSFTGSSYHALLKGHFIPKVINSYATNLPQLILVSGRHKKGVHKILDTIKNDKLDREQIALLRDIFKFNIPGHTGRGFAIYDSESEKTVSISKSFEFYSGSKRPVCFMYSGLGSQWNCMGKELMNIPIFADAIHKCHRVLIPKGLNLVDMITKPEENILDHIMYSLICITAVQIGLTDVLTAIGITPDLIIGHSLGEIGCAYADRCFTAEEAILMAYCRGFVSYKTKFVKGKMAAVGLGYKKVLELSPPDIDIACHNSSNSTTISGPAEVVEKFVDELKQRNIFAKTVATSNIAFHSRYIAKAELKLLSLLKELKIKPKRRSKKWFSTCYMPEQWENEESQFASAEYFTQNLINKVYFEEAAKHIPNDACIIEIAPHGLMQAILKKSHVNCVSLPLVRRNHDNNIKYMLEAIGKLYQNGSNPDVSALYPKVDFPVSTETPGLSHLVQWDHSMEWNFFTENQKNRGTQTTAAYAEFIFSMHDDDYKFIKDYLRNGKNIYPESSLLVLVWKTLAMYNNVNYKELSVKFSDIRFYDVIVIDSQEVLVLNVSIQKVSNMFEVTNKDKVIVNGIIQKTNESEFQKHEITTNTDNLCLTKNEVYKFLSMQGLSLGSSFQCIEATNFNRNRAIMKWNDNWTTFLDSIIQLNLLSELDNTPYGVKRISSINIHVTKHIDSLVTNNLNAEKYLHAFRNTNGKTFCGGIVCEAVIFEQISFALSPSKIYTQEFIPHFCHYPLDVSTAVNVNLQIIYENIPNDELLVNFVAFDNENIFNEIVKEEIAKIYSLEIKLKTVKINDVDNANYFSESDVIVCPDFRNNKALRNLLIERLKSNSFIMLMGNNIKIEEFVANNNIELLTRFAVRNLEMVLLRKRRATKYVDNNSIMVSNSDDLKFEIQNNDEDKLLILYNNSNVIPKKYKNIIKNQLKQGKRISVVDVQLPSKCLINNTFLKQQVAKDLVINVLRNKEWGGYYSIPYKSELNVGTKNVELTENVNITTEGSSFITNIDGIQVYYSAFCKKDSKDIVLKGNKKSSFPLDFSGIDSNGKRVMGCILGESVTNSVPIDPNLLWPVPEHWSLEDAATVPLSYLYAYYCLTIRHKLKSKSSVLVTEGGSALGQAIISLCLGLSCKIFAAVNNEQEKVWLTRVFPQINEDNIITLTVELEFRDFIINATNNERCYVVINCSSGEMRQSAMACVRNFGTFLDLSENDKKENVFFCMKFLDFDKGYVSVRLNSLFNEKSMKNKKKLQTAIAEGIAKGIVKPLLRTVVPHADLSKPIKLLTTSLNVSRKLIKMNDGNNNCSKKIKMLKAKRPIFYSKKVHIVIWDESEFGVEFINRLIEKGAKYLIIHTKQKTLTGYYLAKSLSWTSIKIEISNENLNSIQGCKNLIDSGNKMGDVDGIFIINNDFQRSENRDDPADLIGSNLDFASRNISSLSHFVSLKLVTNNNSEDGLAESERYFMDRKKLGMPSLQIVFKLKEMNYGLKVVSTILDGFEKSLSCKNCNVLVTDQEKIGRNTSEITEFEIKTQIEDTLKIFVDDIDRDEYQATEPIISMKTLTSKYNEDEIRVDPDERKAICISGFLGYYKKLSNVAERLKISAIGLQIPPDMSGSICELAENLLQYIKIKFRLKSKFFIVAYSFGVNIALKVTALLEKEGYHGIVFCLDSSPLVLQYQIKAYLQHFNEDQLQNSIICHMYKLLAGPPSQNLIQTLDNCKIWSEKIDAFINDIKKVVSHSHDYLKDVVNAIYKRILLAKEYTPDMKLNSEIVLIKGIPDPKIDKLPDDYDLSKYTSKPVKVINIDSNYVSVPKDCKISNIINGMLDPELLELFKNKNMCEVYSG